MTLSFGTRKKRKENPEERYRSKERGLAPESRHRWERRGRWAMAPGTNEEDCGDHNGATMMVSRWLGWHGFAEDLQMLETMLFDADLEIWRRR
ncbi:hypothetical protein MRB53_018597 [Persea americana]|uniref:Uncharacterized protein n=1 Tax=Persea americana TaxID=3435 RepID=A0ACC2M8I9_PERAE|nr:hypothetical protein MRB53_018597 [Persea americana]